MTADYPAAHTFDTGRCPHERQRDTSQGRVETAAVSECHDAMHCAVMEPKIHALDKSQRPQNVVALSRHYGRRSPPEPRAQAAIVKGHFCGQSPCMPIALQLATIQARKTLAEDVDKDPYLHAVCNAPPAQLWSSL